MDGNSVTSILETTAGYENLIYLCNHNDKLYQVALAFPWLFICPLLTSSRTRTFNVFWLASNYTQ